jgi:hypothetical protein
MHTSNLFLPQTLLHFELQLKQFALKVEKPPKGDFGMIIAKQLNSNYLSTISKDTRPINPFQDPTDRNNLVNYVPLTSGWKEASDLHPDLKQDFHRLRIISPLCY